MGATVVAPRITPLVCSWLSCLGIQCLKVINFVHVIVVLSIRKHDGRVKKNKLTIMGVIIIKVKYKFLLFKFHYWYNLSVYLTFLCNQVLYFFQPLGVYHSDHPFSLKKGIVGVRIPTFVGR